MEVLTNVLFLAQAPTIQQVGEVIVTPVEQGLPSWALWLITIGLVLACYLLSDILSRAWKITDEFNRLFFFLFSIAAGAVICGMGFYWNNVKLGIDLSGGTILRYELDKEKIAKKSFNDKDFAAIRGALGKLLPPETVDKAVVEPIGTGNRLKVVVPGSTLAERNRIVGALTQPDLLPDGASLSTIDSVTGGAEDTYYELTPISLTQIDALIAGLARRINPGGQKEIKIRPIGNSEVEIMIPKATRQEVEFIKDNISTAGNLEFRILANRKFTDHNKLIELAEQSPEKVVIDNLQNPPKELGRWVEMTDRNVSEFEVTRPGRGATTEALVYYEEEPVVTGDGIRASLGFDPKTNRDCVQFQLPVRSSGRFANLTRDYTSSSLPMHGRLAIVLDDQIASAPNLNDAITSGQGIITGDFTKTEINRIITVLNSGALPSTLNKNPIQEENISAQLGEDTIRSGAIAMLASAAAILIFMWVYYGFCGIVANICVLLNVLLVVAFMIILKAPFTLAGLAGLVLSVGMAVDANVLIFERMREEMARGAGLRMAIRNGFSRAMSTVVDSNLTTLVSGVVLFSIGTEQLKGFATTLILGLLLNLFTAVYCARLLFEIAERNGWLTKLRMMRMIGETKFDFVTPIKACVAISLLVIGLGLFVSFYRGTEFLDIDFTGGTTVQVTLKNNPENAKLNVGVVRKMLNDAKLEGSEVSEVFGQTGEVAANKKFKLVSSNPDLDDTKQKARLAFGDRLEFYQMSIDKVGAYEPPRPVEPAKTDSTKSDPTKETTKSDSSKTEPKQDSPDKTDPPTKSEPMSTEPTKSEPAKSEPTKDDAPKTEPSKEKDSTEKQSLLMPVDAAYATTLIADWRSGSGLFTAGLLLQDEKTTAEPAKTEPAKTEPAKTEPAKTEQPAAAVNSPKPYRSQAEMTFFIPVGDKKEPTPVSRDYLTSLVDAQLKQDKQILRELDLINNSPDNPNGTVSDKWKIITSLEPAELQTLVSKLQATVQNEPIFSQVSKVGGEVAQTAGRNAIWALTVSMIAIVLYVWFRFQNVVFGFAAVIALVHDVLVTLGFLAFSYYMAPYFGWAMVSPFRISLEVVAALLTIIGFSINDTIVIFDRIRELRGKSPDITADMVNRAVNQTLGRTILTSGTVFVVTLILYIFGGEEIHPFSFAMLIGLISGTYSTVYIAAPIVLWFRGRKPAATAVGTRVATATR